jgi:hypothetical protein
VFASQAWLTAKLQSTTFESIRARPTAADMVPPASGGTHLRLTCVVLAGGCVEAHPPLARQNGPVLVGHRQLLRRPQQPGKLGPQLGHPGGLAAGLRIAQRVEHCKRRGGAGCGLWPGGGPRLECVRDELARLFSCMRVSVSPGPLKGTAYKERFHRPQTIIRIIQQAAQ